MSRGNLAGIFHFISLRFSSPCGFPVNQLFISDAEHLAQSFQLNVRYIPFVRLDPCDDIFVHIIACQLKLIGKKTL